MKYPLATSSWDDKELEAIQRVIRSNKFTMGDEVRSFEKEFSEYIGSRFSVMVNSGSSANLLAVASLFYTKNPKYKLKRGDEIIVPAVSWSTTYFPLYQYGLKLKFVDIDLRTLNLDLNQLSSAITPRTRAIFAVNLLGNPINYSRLNELISGNNIIILEDNCESMGAIYDDRKAGTFGLLGTFSCFFSHHISTMEGGLIVTDDEELFHILLSLRAHGWTRNLPSLNKVTSEKEKDKFMDAYRFVLPGYNLRPLEMSGAIGREQIKKLPKIILERRRNAEKFVKRMQGNEHFIIQQETGVSSWFGFSLILKETSRYNRSDIINLFQDKGFEVRPIVTGNFAKSEVIKYFDYSIHGSLVNASQVDNNGLFIGNHHYPLDEAIDSLGSIVSQL